MLGGAKPTVPWGTERSEILKGLLSNLPIGRCSPPLLNEPYEAKRNGASEAGARPKKYFNPLSKRNQIFFVNLRRIHL